MPASPRDFVPVLDDAAVGDLRERLARTRWPEEQPVPDGSQGIELAVLRRLADRWADGYSFERLARRLASVPQVVVDVDGLTVHAVHVRSSRPDAVPLVLGHGWPSTCFEFLDVIGELAEPTDGGQAFHVVCPSLPGYAFGAKPTEPGWGMARTADAWVELLAALGHDRFLVQGGDWGAILATELAVRHPDRLLGLHLTMPVATAQDGDLDDASPAERAGAEREADYRRHGFAYATTQLTRPQTIGYGLVDSPVALAAWVGEKLLAWCGRDEAGAPLLDDDAVLDVVSTYWFTATGASSARLYSESLRSDRTTPVDVATVCSIYPHEIIRPPRAAVARRYRDLRGFRERPRGGHFPAAEVPADFVGEVRAAAGLLLGPGAGT